MTASNIIKTFFRNLNSFLYSNNLVSHLFVLFALSLAIVKIHQKGREGLKEILTNTIVNCIFE